MQNYHTVAGRNHPDPDSNKSLQGVPNSTFKELESPSENSGASNKAMPPPPLMHVNAHVASKRHSIEVPSTAQEM